MPNAFGKPMTLCAGCCSRPVWSTIRWSRWRSRCVGIIVRLLRAVVVLGCRNDFDGIWIVNDFRRRLVRERAAGNRVVRPN